MLKSSSRRSLHADAKEAAKEAQREKDAARELEKERTKLEKERQKKEDKDRSESRISVIINRKRGKVRLDHSTNRTYISKNATSDLIFY